MEALLMVVVGIAAFIGLVLSSANNRIRMGCWLIASGRAMHERRVACRAINEEADLYQRDLEQSFGIREVVEIERHSPGIAALGRSARSAAK